MFGTSLPPVACRRVYVFIMLCLFAHSVVIHVVLLCVFAFAFPCCDVRCDIRIKTMFGTSLPPVACIRAYVIIMLCLFPHSGVNHLVLLCVFTFLFSLL
jgi:hypothetical protein